MALEKCAGGVVKLNTGFVMPLVGFGTYKIVGQTAVTTAVDAALKAGYRLFDTAKYYNNEPELGTALKEMLPKFNLKREDIFLTTKFFPVKDDNILNARKMVEESLASLQTSFLDLVLIHYPKAEERENTDPRNAIDRREIYLELLKLKDEGKIRSVGVSNFEDRHIEELISCSGVTPAVDQVEFHPHFARKQLREYCKQNDIFFQAFSCLARMNPELLGDPTIVNIANAHQTTPAKILIAWPLHLGVGVVPKSASPSRIVENFSAIDVRLAPEEVEKISNLDKEKPYIRTRGWEVL
ncbi:hypothetical protein AB6A40_006827 [Gnathostoma spinigerum]|uniref:NADP-dependent oxidoreductase domain-containing protein n=1 Tax=Gnathostoma spinigerum TaxID=75299 RepID=A0ABD6EJP7_9BILA